jgi:endoglucanase
VRAVPAVERSVERSVERLGPIVKFIVAALTTMGVASIGVSAHAQGAGYWHTSGSAILDANNKTVRIAGINWSGFETSAEVVHGLYAQDYKYLLDAIKSNGYNTVRIPYSNQMVELPIVPSSAYMNFYNGSGPINTDLEGLNSLEILDKIVDYSGQIGLRVILDNHRSENGETAEANGLWYTAQYPESDWINDWETLARRYSGNSTVIGMDLRNEPHSVGSGGAFWTSTNIENDWHLAAERAGDAILKVNPRLLIFVEGTDTKTDTGYWWGGNLLGVASAPVVLSVAHQVVYSAHEYGPNLYQQSWFNAKTTPASLQALSTKMWGYVSKKGIAPVWVGEFGTPNDAADLESPAAGSQGQWFESFISYLTADKNLSWTYWDLGEDTDALLDGDWDATPVSAQKQKMLAAIEFKLAGAVPPGTVAAPQNLTAKAVSSAEIDLTWTASTTAGVKYNVYAANAATVAPSSSTLVASGVTATTYHHTGLRASSEYAYVVEAVSGSNSSAASNLATATTGAAITQAACHVGYSVVTDWGTGYQGGLVIENTGTTALTSWKLTWTFPGNQQIYDFWVGVEGQSGEAVTVTNESYNASIPAGGSQSNIGFLANYSGANTAPTTFYLNGVKCD